VETEYSRRFIQINSECCPCKWLAGAFFVHAVCYLWHFLIRLSMVSIRPYVAR
jgi:hypothetical protein